MELHFDNGQDGHDHIAQLLAQHAAMPTPYVAPAPYVLNTPDRRQ